VFDAEDRADRAFDQRERFGRGRATRGWWRILHQLGFHRIAVCVRDASEHGRSDRSTIKPG
jgi:hypothetical protein